MASSVKRKSHSTPQKTQQKSKTQTQNKTQQNKTNQTQKANETQQAKDTQKTNDLTDRQRGIRDEINSNKKEDGSSEVTAQNGDKFGDVVNASLDKDGDGKLSLEEQVQKEQTVKSLLEANPALADRAKEMGLDINNLSPEDMDKLLNMDLKAGEKVKIPGETQEAKAPEEGQSPEEAKGEQGQPQEAKAPEEAQKGGEQGGGGCQGGGGEGGGEKAGGAQKAQGPQQAQQQKETVESLIAKAAQLIQQAESGGGAAAAQTPTQQAGNPMGVAAQATASANGASAGNAAMAGAQGGSPVQLAQQAKQLLQQAKGMLGQQQGGAQAQQQQPMAAQQPQNGAIPGMQNAQMNGQQNINPAQINEQSLQQMPVAQKLQVIQALDQKANNIIQGQGGQNALASQIAQNNPLNAANNFAAQALMKPQLPTFGGMAA